MNKNTKIILIITIIFLKNLFNIKECLECNIENKEKQEIRNKIDKSISNILEIENKFYEDFNIKNFNKKLDEIYNNLIFIILNLEYFEIGYTNEYIKNIILSNNYNIFNQIIMICYKTLHLYDSHFSCYLKINSMKEKEIENEYCNDILCKNEILSMPIEKHFSYVTNLLHISDVNSLERIIKLIPTININTVKYIKDFSKIEKEENRLSEKYFDRSEKEKKIKKSQEKKHEEYNDMTNYILDVYNPAKKEFDKNMNKFFSKNFNNFKLELFKRAKLYFEKK